MDSSHLFVLPPSLSLWKSLNQDLLCVVPTSPSFLCAQQQWLWSGKLQEGRGRCWGYAGVKELASWIIHPSKSHLWLLRTHPQSDRGQGWDHFHWDEGSFFCFSCPHLHDVSSSLWDLRLSRGALWQLQEDCPLWASSRSPWGSVCRSDEGERPAGRELALCHELPALPTALLLGKIGPEDRGSVRGSLGHHQPVPSVSLSSGPNNDGSLSLQQRPKSLDPMGRGGLDVFSPPAHVGSLLHSIFGTDVAQGQGVSLQSTLAPFLPDNNVAKAKVSLATWYQSQEPIDLVSRHCGIWSVNFHLLNPCTARPSLLTCPSPKLLKSNPGDSGSFWGVQFWDTNPQIFGRWEQLGVTGEGVSWALF